MLDEAVLNSISDPHIRVLVNQLANLLEQALTDIDALRAEIQDLRDENNRLKGEQGKPKIKRNKPSSAPQDKPDSSIDHSSEQQRQSGEPWSKGPKNDRIVVHRKVRMEMDPSELPDDVVFKGYQSVIIQDLILKPDTVCFERAAYYSVSTGKTYLSPLPPGYEGGFGPGLKSLVLGLHHLCNVSQPALHSLLTNVGINVSTGWIGSFLTDKQEKFHQERQEIGLAGLASAPWQQIDDTATRVNGVNQHCHVLGNPHYTTYTTLPKRDRRAVLTVLHNGQPVPLLLTADVLASETLGALPKKLRKVLATWPQDMPLSEADVLILLETGMPNISASVRKKLLDQMALAGYHAQTQVPVVSLLLCDDAPQFPGLTPDLALCWVHDARHYQKLTPHLACYRAILTAFQKKYWDYYDSLLAYRENPTPEKRQHLWEEFDQIFVADTGYEHLDHRIQQTFANKDKLLQVLAHPEIPLHNNASELAVRRRVRKRDVSFGPRSLAGLAAWDTFQTIVATAQKLGVSFLSYVADRVSGRNEMPSLASIITERAGEMNLGASWE